MLALLGSVASLLPIIGPLIDGGVSIYKQKTNTDVTKLRINTEADTQYMQSTNQLVTTFASDAMVKACRDIVMVPGSVYCGTIIWDRWISIQHPEWVWGVLPLQGAMEFLPHALLAFFFGSAFLYWKRK